MDGKFEEVTMINTLIGLLRRTRMPYGIKTASAISKSDGRWHKNIVIYQDNIYIGAVDEKDF